MISQCRLCLQLHPQVYVETEQDLFTICTRSFHLHTKSWIYIFNILHLYLLYFYNPYANTCLFYPVFHFYSLAAITPAFPYGVNKGLSYLIK